MKPNLDELEQLAAKATPRPWKQGSYVPDAIFSTEGMVLFDDCTRRRNFINNISYIVAACNSLPELINENRALQKRVRELEKQAVVLASHLSKHVLHTMSTKEWLEWSESVAKETKC